jgi:hypothetical protein
MSTASAAWLSLAVVVAFGSLLVAVAFRAFARAALR